jgi:acetyl-CoA C-acetyltransferase/acetyl-CoA acyltransferase 2
MKPETPGMTINRLCGSGIQAILDAKRLIQSREAQAILVCGAETMSMTPHLIYGARFGTRYGSFKNSDLLLDTLYDTHIQMSMGQTVEKLGEEFEISRLQADQFAFNSHQKANLAYEKGFIQPELVPISQDKMTLDKDEHLRSELSLIEMQKLRSTFKKDGLTTAASASGIVDGACAMVVANEEFITKNKLTPIAEIVQGQVVGVDPTKMGLGPVPAIEKLIRSRNMDVSEIDYFEINEAFAAQVLVCQKSLNIPDEKLNIWGGAIALGHPLGATGIKITLSLSRQLAIHQKKLGIASACIGGGQGIALLIKSP